ncbi:MAG: amino acid adenylation domain-containing protein [Agarilytica sp.]
MDESLKIDEPAAQAASQEVRSLTPRQLLMWTREQFASSIPTANIGMRFELRGHIDVAKFTRAFALMLAATSTMRTRFGVDDSGEPYQYFVEGFEYDFKFHDVSVHKNPEGELKRWIEQDCATPLDLTSRCFSSALLKCGEDHYIWYICQHHIIADGWGGKVIYERVREAYQNACIEENAEKYTYLDYLDVMQAYPETKAYARAERYWEEKLSTPIEPLKFYSLPKNYSSKVNRITLNLGAERSGALIDLAKESAKLSTDMSIFVMFSTLIFSLAHLVSGNKRIGLGAPMHNRSSKFRGVAGLMMEVCPLVTEFEEQETFRSLMEKVQQDTFKTMRHAQYTTQNSAQARVYDIALNFFNPAFRDFDDAKTISEQIHGNQGVSDGKITKESQWASGEALTVVLKDFSEEKNYHVDFDFNAGVFSREAQEKLVGHFEKILQAFLDDRDRTLTSINVLSECEQSYLLHKINATENKETPLSVVSALERYAKFSPSSPAVIYKNSQLNYADLNDRVNALANHLVSLNVGPEVLVGIYMERSQELLIALLAVMKSGGAYVPFDPHHPADRIEMILEDAQPKVLISDSEIEHSLKVSPNTIVVALDEIWEQEASEENLNLELDERRLAYTIFTSGSTGRPKGVEVSHAALNNFLHSMAREPGLSAQDRLFSVTTISFDIAALELYLPLVVGGSVDLADQDATVDPKLLEQHLSHATAVQATPATFRILLEGGWKGNKKLKVLCGGEAFPRDLADQLRPRVDSVWNMYGPTETTIWSALDRVSNDSAVPIGRPIDNTQVYILNSEHIPVPQGCVGELYIAGEGLARGYKDRAELTQQVFVDNPFSENKKMYRTGDLARYLPDGRLECLGRVDFQVKLRGFRIELGEIETLLGQQEEVNQSVVAIKGEGANKRLVAYVSLLNEVDGAELRERLGEKLPSYMVPSVVVVMNKLPLTPNGKIDRKCLPEPDEEDVNTSSHFIAPETEIEKKIAHVWSDALGVENVSVEDNFFDVGGNSLLAVKVVLGINQVCQSDLSMSVIFETPTVKKLAKRIEENSDGASDASIIQLKQGLGAPLYCICGIHMYQALADALDAPNPVYGVFLKQETEMWQNTDETQRLPTVQALASDYVDAIVGHYSEGPYQLAGISFGGVLAYEMAQQLRAKGKVVSLLSLFDSVLPSAITRKLSLLIAHHMRELRVQGCRYIFKAGLRLLAHLPFMSGAQKRKLKSAGGREGLPQDDAIAFRRKMYTNAMSLYDHVIKPYPDRVVFFRADDRTKELAGCELMSCCGWSRVISDIELHDIRGDHIGILQQPNVEMLARVLSEKLKENQP